jgi:hypothetical protein
MPQPISATSMVVSSSDPVVFPPYSHLPSAVETRSTENVVSDRNPQEQSTAVSTPSVAASISLIVPATEELYPTVTLHSPATAVLCRFSAPDIAATVRGQIGAPNGVTVYAVDGSVIFD